MIQSLPTRVVQVVEATLTFQYSPTHACMPSWFCTMTSKYHTTNNQPAKCLIIITNTLTHATIQVS